MQSSAAAQSTPVYSYKKTSTPLHNNWFEIVSADTRELVERAYRLRYQVYCRERGYEASDTFVDQRETDQFDSRSVHSLLVEKQDNAVIGTVRLVLADMENLATSFPMQHICKLSRLAGPRTMQFATTAEISRLAISKVARKLPSGATDVPGCRSRKSGGSSSFSAPSIMLGLMRAIMCMSHEHGITDWLAVMEPSLLRLLSRFGIYFHPVGPLVEYHGMRQPCQANIRLLLERILKERPDVWEYITDGGKYIE